MFEAPEYVTEQLQALDPLGRFTCEYDERYQRFRIFRREHLGRPEKTFLYCCDPVVTQSNHLGEQLEEPLVQKMVGLGAWVVCEELGELLGVPRDPCWRDLDTLVAISPELAPGGPRGFFKKRRQAIKRLKAENHKEALDRKGEMFERCAWYLRKARFSVPKVTTKEERIQHGEARRRRTERRLRQKGLI